MAVEFFIGLSFVLRPDCGEWGLVGVANNIAITPYEILTSFEKGPLSNDLSCCRRLFSAAVTARDKEEEHQKSDARGLELDPPPIRVFGGLSVHDADLPINIGGPKQRRLLALLVARPGALIENDWLAEYLWSDDKRPDPPAPALRTAVSRLRQAMPDYTNDWIVTEPSGYRWIGPNSAVEHLWFAELREQADETEDPALAYELLTAALGAWRGDPFSELEGIEWATALVEELRLTRLETMEERWELALALQRHSDVIGELASFTAENGLRDRAVRQHALALYRAERSADALRVIDAYRRQLADETGLDPAPPILDLESAILTGKNSVTVEPALRRIRGYRLLELAGNREFAVVWRGHQVSVNRQVAVKLIRPDLMSETDFIRRFESEALLVARLDHLHIAPLIDFWTEPKSAFLVMRWLDGGTLTARLANGPLSATETALLAKQIGSALVYAHAAGIAHRQLKPANILFDELGNAYLTDFGIAAESSDTLNGSEPSLEDQFRADVFQLGTVLLQCLETGSRPSDASQLTACDSLSAFIEQAVAESPNERFDSATEFMDTLMEQSTVGLSCLDEPYLIDVADPNQRLQVQ